MKQYLPLVNENGYELAYKLACGELAKIDDIKQRSSVSGNRFQKGKLPSRY
ncbi:hypothetical protein M1N05_02370 [Dehalococcoidales bacterium]|nr:hypothetical protein [Dehalococcoidales bacterium]